MPGDSLSTAGFFGELIIKIIFAIAEWDRKNITQNIRTSMAFKRTKGELCGTVPYGWNAVGTGQSRTNKAGKTKEVLALAPNPEEQAWLVQMNTWRQSGLSYKGIADQLNALNVPTKVPAGTIICVGTDPVTKEKIMRPHSGRWQSGNVAKVLSSTYTTELFTTGEKAA